MEVRVFSTAPFTIFSESAPAYGRFDRARKEGSGSAGSATSGLAPRLVDGQLPYVGPDSLVDLVLRGRFVLTDLARVFFEREAVSEVDAVSFPPSERAFRSASAAIMLNIFRSACSQ